VGVTLRSLSGVPSATTNGCRCSTPPVAFALVSTDRSTDRDVRIHVLRNTKSGMSPEDCGFCSQSVVHGPRWRGIGQGYEADLRMIAEAGFRVAELVEA